MNAQGQTSIKNITTEAFMPILNMREDDWTYMSARFIYKNPESGKKQIYPYISCKNTTYKNHKEIWGDFCPNFTDTYLLLQVSDWEI